MDFKSSKNNLLVRKRPEIALYKPGMGKILTKKGDINDTINVHINKQDMDEEIKSDTISSKSQNYQQIDNKEVKSNANNNKTITKKPDIKVYVPPKLSTGQQSLSLSGSTEPQDKTQLSSKSSDKSSKGKHSVHISENNNNNNQYNQKSGNSRQKSERYDRQEKNERRDRRDNRRSDRNQRHNSSGSAKQDKQMHEIDMKSDETQRFDKQQRSGKTDKIDKKDRNEKIEERTDRRSQLVSQMKNKAIDRVSRDNQNTENIKQHIVHKEENSKTKLIEPKLSENYFEKSNIERYENYDDYYNVDIISSYTKVTEKDNHKRHNNNNINNNNNRNNNHSSGHSSCESNRNQNEIKREKSLRGKQDSNNNKRNTFNNKSQPNHRYNKTYEQQIPPRFLKQQQLKKQNEISEQMQPQEEKSCYENQRRESLKEEQLQTSTSRSPPQRGLIRLPTNQVNPNDWAQQQQLSAVSQIPHQNRNIISNKPCVAIRPTQHVSVDKNPSQYSPSSSPDTNSLSTATDNYHQLSPYVRNNYSEYSIPHFMSTTSVENNESFRKRLKPIIEKSLNEATAAETDLSVCHDPQKMEPIRYRIQLRYEHIILNDLRVCAETNIEQRLWKSAFYQFIEHYRRLMEQNTDQQTELKTCLHKIIDEASLFFENLLAKMQETYDFTIEKLLAHEYDSDSENYETIKLASISAQKIYLYLGDLSRYRECETKNSKFVKSKFFYLRAQMLAPKNGRSYNQLALLAMYQNRRLDAVYYYMRSLAASNPFLTARENLLTIFDECRRKYELNEKKRNQDLLSQKKRIQQELDGLGAHKERLEIWIRNDGKSDVCSNFRQLLETDSETVKENLDTLSSVDLNKRFVLSFLHTHGKLFSRVGMETFIPVVNQMLAEFQSLLRRSPIPVMSQRLSQLLAINMFAVFNTSLKDTTYGQNCRSLLQEQAIQVTLAMMSLILECAINLLKTQNANENKTETLSDDLTELLPTIKIWTDWMSCQKQLWCPPPPSSDFNVSSDIWSIFAEFLTLLTKVNIKSVKLFGSKLDGCEPIILPEDTSLAGFLPLLGSPQCVQYAQPNYDKEKAKTCLRLTAIQYFGDYLCGIVEPYLKYDVENKRFVSLIQTSALMTSEEKITKPIDDLDSEPENDEFTNEISSEETLNSDNTCMSDESLKSPDQIEIEKLWSLQEKLKKTKDRQEVLKQTVDAVLNEVNQRKQSRIVIQPRYIIPDTNCYIDHLDKIKRIINTKFYDLIVPLIVINELNGLKTRGIKIMKPLTFSSDHSGVVAKAAMDAIDYLVIAFNDKSLRLRAITSKGSILDSINFISESITDSQGCSNDDLILSACHHFIKEKTNDNTIKENVLISEEVNSLFREVVLLTDDRNLRVKALGHNVPVKGVQQFVKWANIYMVNKRVL